MADEAPDTEEAPEPDVEAVPEGTAATPAAVAEAFEKDKNAQQMASKWRTELRRQEKRRSYHKRKREKEHPFATHGGHRSARQKTEDMVAEAGKGGNMVYVAGGLGVAGLIALAMGLK